MEIFLILCLLVVCLARWIWLRGRLAELEQRIITLERQDNRRFIPEVPITPPKPPPAAPPKAPDPPPPPVRPIVPAPAPAPPSAPRRDWEAVVGGNWLNKLGVFILVIGIALALGYSFTRVGPGGRVAISLAASFAMLATGAALEPSYRVFARGLLGGGWAALYFTVYAMHAVDAARVLDNPYAATVLLLGVAAGMIAHSLRYRSETVTGLAYFIAFVTLAIAESGGFAVPALLPLAVSLLYIARRFAWRRFALLGVIGAYVTIALRGDTGAPLWQAQAVFAVFWLVFEAVDLLTAEGALFPLNAAGFLGLSILAWQHHAPDQIWRFAAASAVAYLVSAILRAKTDWWPAAAALSAALAASAIFLRAEGQWTAFALLLEAEALYLAGIRLRAPFLRHLATAVFVLEIAMLVIAVVPNIPPSDWVPVAALSAAVFYANSFVDRFHGYAGAAMLALIAAYESPRDDRGLSWTLLAAATFAAGWYWRRIDFRLQAYALALLGILGMVAASPEPRLSLAIAAVVFYAGAITPSLSDRLEAQESGILPFTASLATAGLVAAIASQSFVRPWQGIAWMAVAAVLLELGIRDLPADLRRIALGLAACGAAIAVFTNLDLLKNYGPLEPRLAPLAASALAYLIAYRARESAPIATFAGAGFLAASAWALLPESAVGPAWAAIATVLVRAPRRVRGLDFQSYLLAAAAFVRVCNPIDPVPAAAAVIALLFLARLPWSSLAAGALLAIVLYHHVSGSALTVVWAAEGIALLAAGFPLRDRVLRLSGLATLLGCILKAFVYDLSYLDTLPRIFSFIVLGLILVTVSWLYARFRDRLQRLL
jgi:uncharacterized membrane protein